MAVGRTETPIGLARPFLAFQVFLLGMVTGPRHKCRVTLESTPQPAWEGAGIFRATPFLGSTRLGIPPSYIGDLMPITC
jgi:hypothetical protein